MKERTQPDVGDVGDAARSRRSLATGIIMTGMRTPKLSFYTAVLMACVAGAAQPSPEALHSVVREYRQRHEAEIVRDYARLLAIPNVAADAANIRGNADFIAAALEKRGFKTRLLSAGAGSPVVYGELPSPGAKHTVLWYAHYDGQPVDKSQWASDPWTPVIRDGLTTDLAKVVPLDSLRAPLDPEWRIYARAASDDKAPIQALLTAIDALSAAQAPVGINLKVFFEGEEEAGSPHLDAIMRKNAELLKGDLWLLCDGPLHQTRRMQLFFGARGVVDLEMTVYGPTRALHDGHYGNWAPNPAALLIDLLARMRDSDSHIRIPGYYDDVRPLSPSERQAIAQIPDVETQLKQELGLAWTESKGQPVAMAITQPALNIRGLEAGHVESKAQNAISPEAKASLDFRLVPDQKPEKVRAQVELFIRQQGFYIVNQTPGVETRRIHAKIIKLNWGTGYPAARTSMDDPAVLPLISAIEETLGAPVVKMPMLGGSVPMYLFTDLLKTPVVGVPIVNHDNNQHAANENLRLQNLWDGIEIFAGILTQTEQNWAAEQKK